MPKDTPVADLLDEAQTRTKQMGNFTDAASTAATALEAAFKKDKPDLDFITQAIDQNEKWLGSIERDLTAADKLLKQLSKQKDASVKKPAQALEAAADKAGKAIEKLRNLVGIAEKIASKAEVDDKKLASVLAQTLKIAELRINELGADRITVPKITAHMGDCVKKVLSDEWPVSIYLDRVPVFVRDLSAVKGHTLAAGDAEAALQHLAKKGAQALSAELQSHMEKLPGTQKRLSEACSAASAELKNAVASLEGWRKDLDYKVRNAA